MQLLVGTIFSGPKTEKPHIRIANYLGDFYYIYIYRYYMFIEMLFYPFFYLIYKISSSLFACALSFCHWKNVLLFLVPNYALSFFFAGSGLFACSIYPPLIVMKEKKGAIFYFYLNNYYIMKILMKCITTINLSKEKNHTIQKKCHTVRDAHLMTASECWDLVLVSSIALLLYGQDLDIIAIFYAKLCFSDLCDQ
ncbi:hypothetical protein ACJX0J_027447 [Zea mays]